MYTYIYIYIYMLAPSPSQDLCMARFVLLSILHQPRLYRMTISKRTN